MRMHGATQFILDSKSPSKLHESLHNVYDPQYLLKVKKDAEKKCKKSGMLKRIDESVLTYEEPGL